MSFDSFYHYYDQKLIHLRMVQRRWHFRRWTIWLLLKKPLGPVAVTQMMNYWIILSAVRTKRKWQLFEISARLKLVSVPFSSLVLYWSPWEKFPGEHHVKLWDGTKLLRFAESASSNIVLYSRFISAKRINHPDPGWDRKVRYCSLF